MGNPESDRSFIQVQDILATMTSFEGFWIATFDSKGNIGRGVLFATNGSVYGGDSSYSYWGQYVQEGDKVTAKVYLRPHSSVSQNVFGIQGPFGLDLEMKMVGATIALGSAINSSHGNLSFDLRLDRVTQIDPKKGY